MVVLSSGVVFVSTVVSPLVVSSAGLSGNSIFVSTLASAPGVTVVVGLPFTSPTPACPFLFDSFNCSYSLTSVPS